MTACGLGALQVMRDSDGKSKGFGFVCYTTPEEATRAVTDTNSKMFQVGPLPPHLSFAPSSPICLPPASYRPTHASSIFVGFCEPTWRPVPPYPKMISNMRWSPSRGDSKVASFVNFGSQHAVVVQHSTHQRVSLVESCLVDLVQVAGQW